MNINIKLSILCILLIILSCGLLIFIELKIYSCQCLGIIKNISIGILSSSIVSLFFSLTNYFVERKEKLNKIIYSLNEVYIAQRAMIDSIGIIFSRHLVINIEILKNLCNDLSGLSQTSYKLFEEMKLREFKLINRFCTLNKKLEIIYRFGNMHYTLNKLCNINYRDILKYENCQYVKHKGFLCYVYLENFRKRLLNLKNELYSQNVSFEKFLCDFYSITKTKPNWPEEKLILDKQVEEILKFKFY